MGSGAIKTREMSANFTALGESHPVCSSIVVSERVSGLNFFSPLEKL